MRALLLLLIVLLVCACRNSEDPAILYVFKGEVTTVAEFKQRYYEWQKTRGIKDSREMRENFLNSLIFEEVLYDKGKKEGIEYSPDVKRKIEDYKKRLIIDAMKERIDRELFPLDEERIKKHYLEHKEAFIREKLWRLYGIRVKDREKAWRIREMIEKGESLRLLSARYSDDKNLAMNNGDWGLFSPDTMDEAWQKEVLKAPLGELVGPVRDAEGMFTLIEVGGYAYKRELSFERAYPLIVRDLLNSQGTDAWKAYRARLFEEYGIRINMNNMQWDKQ